jgi:hypothetical protein
MEELEPAIYAWLAHWNDRPKAFVLKLRTVNQELRTGT